MSLQIGRFTPYDRYASVSAARAPEPVSQPQPELRAPAAQKPGVETGTILGDVPPAPTPEARELVAKAAEVAQKLHDSNRELHFEKDRETGRVIIEVKDLDGNTLKTIPPKHALDFLTGDADL